MPTGAQQSLVRRINDEMVCQLLRDRGALSRGDVARLAGISVPAALKMVNRLIQAGLVVEVGDERVGRRGPRSVLFGLAPDFGTITAIEVRADTLRVRHRTLRGDLVAGADLPFDRDADVSAQVVSAASGQAGSPHVVVVGLPGSVDPVTGDVAYAAELPGWEPGTARRIADALATLGAAVLFDNEVNLRADAECDQGVAGSETNFVLVSLGSGVGAAVVIDGHTVRGAHGSAGEIGYMRGTAMTGESFQDVAGAWNLAHAASAEHDPDFHWLLALRDRAGSDPAAVSVWRRLAQRIVPGLATLVSVVDPAVVVLAGETSRIAGAPLRDAIAESLASALPWPAPTVVLSTMGDEAVLAGAQVRGWRRLIHDILDAAGEAP